MSSRAVGLCVAVVAVALAAVWIAKRGGAEKDLVLQEVSPAELAPGAQAQATGGASFTSFERSNVEPSMGQRDAAEASGTALLALQFVRASGEPAAGLHGGLVWDGGSRGFESESDGTSSTSVPAESTRGSFLRLPAPLVGERIIQLPREAWTMPGEAPRPPFQVHLEVYGSALVEVTFADGSVPRRNLRLLTGSPGGGEVPEIFDGAPELLPLVQLRGGAGELERLLVGGRTTVWLTSDTFALDGVAGQRIAPTPFEVALPDRDGATATWKLELPTPRLRVQMQLVGVEGEGVEEVELFVAALDSDGVAQMSAMLTSGPGGRIGLELDNDVFSGNGLASVRVGELAAHPRAWRIDLPEPLTAGVHDFGVVAPEALVPLVSGRVVDERGRPVPEGTVSMAHWAVAAPGERPRIVRPPLGFGSAHPILGPDGSFELRSPRTESALVVHASSAVGRSDTVRVQPGVTGLVLTLRESGSLRIQCGVEVSVSELEIVLAGGAITDQVDAQWQFERPEPTGVGGLRVANPYEPRMFTANVPHGAYDLWRVKPGTAEPELLLDGLVVPPGGVCEDPRLAALRLGD